MNGIKYFRKKNRMTQSNLAKMLDVTQTSVSQWESGRNYPDIKTAKRLAELFSASLDQILGTVDMAEEDLLMAPSKKRIILEAREDLDEKEVVLLEQKMRLVELMDKLSPLARQRVIDRAEIYYEIQNCEAANAAIAQKASPASGSASEESETEEIDAEV
ncbi:MAG: helix-turn-helix transcriptional regulator [Saccharofermentanales bacterium]